MSEKNPQQLYQERNQRFNDAISLKEPDRVPIAPFIHFYPIVQKGLSHKVAMYEPERLVEAAIEVFSQYNWDQMPSLLVLGYGHIYDALGVKCLKWAGAKDEQQRLGDNMPFQFVEGEYIKADEYNYFFSDPTGFMLRKILPRHNSNLKAFSEFPNIVALGYETKSRIYLPLFFSSSNTMKMMQSIEEASKSIVNLFEVMSNYVEEMKKLGYPVASFNASLAPFDIVSDMLRGMRGSMIDMYRRPEELKKMIDILIQPTIDLILNSGKKTKEKKIVFIPLHRGADGFMSNKQFAEFYWPSLTKVMEAFIVHGFIPEPFFEGRYTERLEYLVDFAKQHKGKLIYWFDKTDIIKAKEILGDYVCIRGNVPGSLLVAGTPQQVEDYVKTHIEGCMEGGGYIVDGAVSGIPDEARHENVKAMTDAVFKYGVYRK